MAERFAHNTLRSMAPFISYPSKTLENLDRLSETYEERDLGANPYNGCNDESTFQDTAANIPTINFARCVPLPPSVELYAPLRIMSALTMNESVVSPPLASSMEAIEQSAADHHLKSPEVVGITLAFLSVVLGLIAMAVTRSQWYRRKQASSGEVLARTFSCGRKKWRGPPATQIDPFCSQIHINVQEAYSPTLEQYSPAPRQEEKLPVDDSYELKRFTVGEDEGNEETEKRLSDTVPQEFTDYIVQQESAECTPSENIAPSEYEMAVSQESGSSQQTVGNDILERFSNASSSKTSIMSMGEGDDEDAEEMEETGEVHRAQTQSMDFKRAVLVSFPTGGHMTVLHHQ